MQVSARERCWPRSDGTPWLILATESRPFFLAALRELRLDSAAAVSGWGSQGPAERRPLRILMR